MSITFLVGDATTGCRTFEKNTGYADMVSSPRTGRPLKCLKVTLNMSYFKAFVPFTRVEMGNYCTGLKHKDLGESIEACYSFLVEF